MRVFYAFMFSVIIASMSCSTKAGDEFSVFLKGYTSYLSNSNYQKVASSFSDVVYIHGFGEVSYKITATTKYDGFGDKKGPLFIAIFESDKTKDVYGYPIRSFSEAFGSNSTHKTGKDDKGNYYAHVVFEGLMYSLAFKAVGSTYKLWDLSIKEM